MAIRFALHQIPFSRRGSYLALFRKSQDGLGGDASRPISIRCLSGSMWECPEIFHLAMLSGGAEVLFAEESTGEVATLQAQQGGGTVRIVFQDADTIRFRGQGAGLALNSPSKTVMFPHGPKAWQCRVTSTSQLIVNPLVGQMTLTPTQDGKACTSLRIQPEGGVFELTVRRITSSGRPAEAVGSFDDCVNRTGQEIRQWVARFAAMPAGFEELGQMEAFILWNLLVNPHGNNKRELVLASKVGLVGTWSWDHMWNVLALRNVDADMAWDQLMGVIDHQDEMGAFPDCFSDNTKILTYVKPPIHGFMLGWLERNCDWVGRRHWLEAYGPLCKATNWWLDQRDDDGDGVPHYLHGNDSGWDNSTAFDEGTPLESPDLSAWLILQMEWLASTATRLGFNTDAAMWKARATDLQKKMLEHFWTGDRLVAKLSTSHKIVESESLLVRLPLVLGKRLPKEVQDWLIGELSAEGRFLCEHGYASEALTSPKHKTLGYWRGNIWPATILIVVDALQQVGQQKLAASVIERFLKLVRDHGDYENYDARTGAGQFDHPLAWTACNVLILGPQIA